jgi:ABC-type branched-subunit amino acid transport system substrate-binding protein
MKKLNTQLYKYCAIYLSLTFLVILTGCTLPASLTTKLPWLNQVNSLDCDRVRVGALLADNTSPVAREQRDGYELALAEIKQNGGVAGCDLKLFFQVEAPDNNPRQTYQAVRSLVEEDRVLALIGATTNTGSMMAASLSNYFFTPMLVPSAGGSHILPTDNRWAFRLHADESVYAQTVFDLVKAKVGTGIQTVIVFEDTSFGNDAAIAAANSAKLNEQPVIGYFAYRAEGSGVDILAKNVIALNPQLIYMVFTDTTQAESILNAIHKEKGNSQIIEIARSGGFASQVFLQAASKEANVSANNLILSTSWSGQMIAETANDDSFQSRYTKYTLEKYGTAQNPSLYSAEAYKSLMIVATSLKNILSSQATEPTDIAKIRENLRQVLFDYKESTSTWGVIDFSNGGQNQAQVILLQMLGSKWQVVYPAARATSELILDYEQR